MDDQERVVDRKREADERDEIRHVRARREDECDAGDRRERSGDRARRERERNEDRERRAEHEDEHGERERDGDCLAASQVRGEHRIEVVLNGRLARHPRARPVGAAKCVAERLRVLLGVVQFETRGDLAVEDPTSVAELARLAGRHLPRGDLESAFESPPQHVVGRVAAEDDDKGALGTLVEVLLEQRAGALRLGSRDVERCREQARQLRRCEDAGGEDDEPGRDHERPGAEDGEGPALQHGLTLLGDP